MVSAPGKLVVLGDYAVLEGGAAMVAAIDRRAAGELVPNDRAQSADPSAVVQAVQAHASPLAFDPAAQSIHIDTSSFSDERRNKLGLGSSAAAAVVAAALALGRRDEAALQLALRAHREATGGGSGIDVAASFYGGMLAARAQPSEVRALPSALPGLHLFVLFTGESASTKELILACQRAPSWKAHAVHLSQLAERGLRAWSHGQGDHFLEVVALYGRAMDALGRDSGAEIVTEPIRAVMRLAGEADSAAKPSGAGGGDVVIGFSKDPELGARLAQRTGLLALDLRVDPTGLRR